MLPARFGVMVFPMPLYDPYMPEIKDDPYPIYARLRAEAPIYHVERFDAWALARFEDIWEASQDGVNLSTCNATSDLAFLEREPAPFEALSNMDPPEHTEVRKKVFPLFGPKAARALAPTMREWARNCLDRHADTGRIDAVEEFARQVAVRVACSVSGFRHEDADFLLDVVARFFRREEGTEGLTQSGLQARDEMHAYLEMIGRDAQKRGRLDVAAGRFAEHVGSSEENLGRLVGHLTLLLVGATDTFPKVFASMLLRLWENPDQRRALVDDPSLIPLAITETLRYDMPTQWLGRTVIRDMDFRGHKFRKGQPVLFLYPSGNRDEAEFDTPDRFDIHRNAPRILSFGHGVHRCLGAFMARMEGQVLLEEILARYPDYEVLTDECVRPATEFVQGYSNLPIAFGS